ncbi:hypothetical protein LEP1GSC043_2186 [Leptospira weilii str. Ecochallenge]|uniref:Uncharacterized protein n=1 Tax=Leptospira weilii str. Ecochallenge TaxID=1049986 RepID=N1U5Y6_9LEPT|nr:hypothetical protein LEP1GSC043_2186 [Leptospira weilii str. Ecochallenge]
MEHKKESTYGKFGTFFISGIIFFTTIQPTIGEDILPKEVTVEEEKGNSGDLKNVLRLTLKDAVNHVLEKNITIQNAKMEYIKADGGELKNESQFTWNLIGGITIFKTTLPNNRNNIFLGTKQSQDKLSVGIEKILKQELM